MQDALVMNNCSLLLNLIDRMSMTLQKKSNNMCKSLSYSHNLKNKYYNL